ncbi:3'-5' exonuclease [Algiphilus sp. W345]|uniref:3'-5' exonuclease n=1 Tax=Banduia mediterranea TaxID=3075609 RepID=A0ABU2WM15_9GAMM|nr:3'-5' exonuclease [Algiphilus sp. W345]MDT0498580.1 3'-5' exonuclease [Algiphilus sp. W345]
MSKKYEVFISVDIEAAGPIPGEYSMLTVGACLVEDPARMFSCAIKPVNDRFVPQALEVTGLSMAKLAEEGLDPEMAMRQFEAWIASTLDGQGSPVFVGLNAPFDWSFVNYYFHRFLGRNPFGFTALDIKAVYMGATGCSWHDTRSSEIARRVHPNSKGDHNALRDALYQAELFRLVRSMKLS